MASSGERYHRLKEEGRCVDCGCVLPPRWGYVRCSDCREMVRAIKEERKPTHESVSLDEMAKEAHEKHLTYGQLQRLKLLGKEG